MLSGVVSGLQWESGQFSQEMGNSSEVNHQPAISMMLCILRQYVHTLKPSHLKCAIFFFVYSCIVQPSQQAILEYFCFPWSKSLSASTPPSSFPPWQAIICFVSQWIYLFIGFCINGTTQYGVLCLASFTEHFVFMVHLKTVACVSASFLFCAWIRFCCMDGPHLIYRSLVGGHLGDFLLGTLRKNAAVDIRAQVFVWTYVLFFFFFFLNHSLCGCSCTSWKFLG